MRLLGYQEGPLKSAEIIEDPDVVGGYVLRHVHERKLTEAERDSIRAQVTADKESANTYTYDKSAVLADYDADLSKIA